VPPSGARLLVASDGVWDAYEKMTRIGSMLRNWSLDTCPQRLIQARRCGCEMWNADLLQFAWLSVL
jgi:hypothetical protein